MGFWGSLARKILDPLGVHRIFEKHAESPRKASGGFTMQSADRMHGLIVAAGQGNAAAKGQLDAIKAAAARGDPAALRLMKYITPIARMVEGNLGSPSSLAQRLAMSRRQPTGRPAQTTQAALQREQKTRAALRKAQEQIKAARQAQIQRAQKEAFHTKVQLRFQQEQAKFDAEIQAYDDKLVAVQRELEKRDWDQKTREALEGQAAAYEAEIDKLKAAKEGQPAPAVSPTDTTNESAEGEASMDEAGYPTGNQGGVPGDIEMTD